MRPLRIGIACSVLAAAVPGQQWVSMDGPAGLGRAFAWDSWRGRAVMVGTDGETWEWDGTRYLHRPAAVAPPPRTQTALAFDSVRGHTLLFGGVVPSNNTVGDTWTWDGSQWRQPFSLLSPSRRANVAMTFDAQRARVVMFGGFEVQNSRLLAETWEHDGSQWQQCTPATVPPAFPGAGLCFDGARGVSVLLLSVGLVAKTYEWNGVDWTLRSSGGPLVSNGAVLAYDSSRQRSVMYGGDAQNEVWEWDGVAWLARGPTNYRRNGHGMAFDDRAGRVLIAGGYDNGFAATEVLAWSGAGISVVAPVLRPPQRGLSALAHDSLRRRLVLFGGSGVPGMRDDLWEWDGRAWLQSTASPRPPARIGAACCFDPVRGRVLLFSGSNGQVRLTDFWSWDGSSWSSIAVPTPPARLLATMTWDSIRQRVVLYGGDGLLNGLSDTWSWDGNSWRNLTPPVNPGSRWAHAMAFDPGRDRVVLYGGTSQGAQGPTTLLDTWEFDGSTWAAAVPLVAPGIQAGSMTFDPRTGRCALMGNVATPFRQVERWDFDGSTWVQLGSFARDAAASFPQAATDTFRQRVVVQDGLTVREYGSPTAASVPYGRGCGNPEPRLSARTLPRVSEPDFGLEAWGSPGMPALFALATSQGNVALGQGCSLLLQQVMATAFVVADAHGLAVQPIPLPANHALRGLLLFAQAGILAPSSPGGLMVTQGLQLTIGD